MRRQGVGGVENTCGQNIVRFHRMPPAGTKKASLFGWNIKRMDNGKRGKKFGDVRELVSRFVEKISVTEEKAPISKAVHES